MNIGQPSDLTIWADHKPWFGLSVGLIFASRTHIAEPITFRPIKPSEETNFIDPSIRITREQAQHLMDQLWTCGLRPTEGAGSAGALAATERHLRDMQQLVFKEKGGRKP